VELSGNTRFLSLFDVVQVLSVNGATGMLRVDDGLERGYLYFQEGAVINAMDADNHDGEDAARRVFALRNAAFSFSSDLPSVAHRISCSTQNLMMEVARRLDEEGRGEGPHLDEAQQATTLLNELFTRIDTESKVLSHTSPQGIPLGDLLTAVRESPHATLFLRAGARPEVQVGGRLIPISETVIDAEGYASLRDHLLRESDRGHRTLETAGAIGAHTLSLNAAESYAVDVLAIGGTELCTIRRLSTVEELLSSLPWSGENLDSLLGTAGSIALVTARDGGTLERSVAAASAYLLRHGPAPFLGSARRWPPGLGAGVASAVLLDSAREDAIPNARELIDRMGPAVYVAADADAAGALTLAHRAAGRGARVLVGVRALKAAAAPARWLDALDPSERHRAMQHLAAALTGILSVEPAPGCEGHVHPLTDAARDALRRGDLDTVTRELAAAARG
jgi:Domain of unknown function (DUF4388)